VDERSSEVAAPTVTPGESGAAPMADSKVCAQGCLLETVLFGFDSGRLRETEAKKLDKIAATVTAGDSLRVDGYTCQIGTKSYNLKLSSRRAKAVASYLKKKGVVVSHAEGKGECCQVSKLNKRLNRRVEIKKQGGEN